MSTVKQIAPLLNDVAKQVFGSEAITVTDLGSFVSLGDKVLSSGTDTDVYLNKLVDKIGRVRMRADRTISKDTLDFHVEPFEFGSILQKVDVELPKAVDNNAWKIGESGFQPDPYFIEKPDVRQSLFQNIDTWAVRVTIPDEAFRTAWRSPEEMSVFISGIFTTYDNALTVQMDIANHMAAANFIGEKVAKNNGIVNLLTEYNTEYGTSITAKEAMRTAEFYKFSGKRIKDYIKFLSKPSQLYNTEGRTRWTEREYLNLNMLGLFADGYSTYLSSDTFHKELVELPRYSETAYWQGTGDKATFDSCSSIDIVTASGETVQQKGIVAVASDKEAIFTMWKDKKSKAQRNEIDEYTNYKFSVTTGWANDLSENGIVFVVADPS